MKNLILAAIAVACLVGGAMIDFENQDEARFTVCDNPPVFEKQIINLPEDGNAYFTTCFLPDNWKEDPKSRALVAWFESHDQLKSLKSQTHWNIYTANSAMYQSRYRMMVTALPAVVIQKPDGTRVYQQQGEAVPNSASALAADIQGQLYTNCPWRKPDEPPPADPVVDEPPNLDGVGVPDMSSGGGTDWAMPSMLLIGISALAGLGLGVGTGYYEQYYGNTL